MGMSVSLHAKRFNEWETDIEALITVPEPHHIAKEPYPVIRFSVSEGDERQEVTIFPSFEQVEELHEKLGKLLEEAKERSLVHND